MRRFLYLSPFLFGAFLIVGLYSSNTVELTRLSVIVPPLLVVLGSTAFVELGLSLTLRSWPKASLITTFLLLCTFLYNWVKGSTGLTTDVVMVPVWLVFMACGLVLLSRSKGKRLDLATKGLFLLASCILVVGLANFTIRESQGSYKPRTRLVDVQAADNLPDTYLIVLDRYGSSYSENICNYLDSKGFCTPDTYANYPGTLLSLGSLLSMDYLDDSIASSGDGTSHLVSFIQKSELGCFAKDLGYTYVRVGGWWSVSSSSLIADVTYSYSSESRFSWMVYRPTVIYPIVTWITSSDFESYCRKSTIYEFDKLLDIPDNPDPTFTFAHILCPHEPYVFGDTYEEQVAYVDTKIKEVVDSILEKDSNSIIVVMADEAQYTTEFVDYWKDNKSFTDIGSKPDLIRGRMGILFGAYVPGMSEEQLGKSPVNLFRSIGNYMGWTDLEILPDRYYFPSKYRHPYKWVDVTDCIEEVE